jgi:hypothetical protein
VNATNHKKVIAGADWIVVLSMYPAPPATIQPTASPTMILIFFINGEPNISVRMIVAKDRKPRPINSGEPQLKRSILAAIFGWAWLTTYGSGRGARVVGQSIKIPLVGKSWQPLEPPPQFGMPDAPTRDAPIKRMTVPR